MIVADHGGALEYDLITRTRFTLDDVGGALSVRALRHFVRYLPPDSATVRELRDMDGEEQLWQEPSVIPSLIASAIDAIQGLNYTLVCANTPKGRRPRAPEPIPRPGVVSKTRHYGSDPIPIKDFDNWWKEGNGR